MPSGGLFVRARYSCRRRRWAVVLAIVMIARRGGLVAATVIVRKRGWSAWIIAAAFCIKLMWR
jgi:hypothetical protein